ncbi:hypothetical protein PJWF_00061 [Achromobacter phage JWF]|uniref:hypothetical protein n=1 Tax=Achromobacter phage JWF TaxID=1589748 RepID=UPI000588E5E8|nr:hypothetical protein AXJ13_gp061 [Achromobacter phage JWF]AJD82955.1 hypothetical protein PJWF_00061 [Achromobacter phage JWF]
MSDPIQAAIQAAQNAAGAAAQVAQQAPANTAVATTQPSGGAVATTGQKMSMETLMAGGMTVDVWVKCKEFGLLVGQTQELVSSFKAYIDMTDGVGFSCKQSIKAGNPAQYWSTYDGAMSDKGVPWNEAIQKAVALDPKARPYRSVDVPMVLLEDIKSPKGVELAKAGQRAGYSTSTTNWSAWESFYKAVQNAGLLGKCVEVVVSFEAKSNKNNNTWGIMTWELVGEMTQDEGGDE